MSCSSVLTIAAKRDDVGILGVAQEGDPRHRQVLLDQEGDRLARLGRQLQPLHHRLRQAHALGRVILVAPLADVVVEQRQDQQFRRVELADMRGEALAVRRLGRRAATRCCGWSAACARRRCSDGRSRG